RLMITKTMRRTTTILSAAARSGGLPAFFPGPGIFEGDAAVEDRVGGLERAGVADEVAEAFELHRDARPGVGEGGLQFAVGENFEAGGVEVVLPVFAVGDAAEVLDPAEVIVQSHLGVEGVLRADPVERGLHFAAVGGVAAAGLGVVGGVQFDDFAGVVLDDTSAS